MQDTLRTVAPPVRRQRSHGVAAISIARGTEGSSRLVDLDQRGCARLRMPARAHPGEPLAAIAINTAGGLTAGDRIEWSVDVGPGARASVTTQAAERLYRAEPGTGEPAADVRVNLSVGAGGSLLWWPQETIAFEGCAMRRRLAATLAPGARLMVVEAFAFGRLAMGERVRAIAITDDWRVRSQTGTLEHAEALRIGNQVGNQVGGGSDLAGPGSLDGRAAMATVLLVGPDAESLSASARTALDSAAGPDVTAAATLIDGPCCGPRLLARIVAADGYALRRVLVPLATRLAGQPVPRAWSM